jgi:hypothetical protein
MLGTVTGLERVGQVERVDLEEEFLRSKSLPPQVHKALALLERLDLDQLETLAGLVDQVTMFK